MNDKTFSEKVGRLVGNAFVVCIASCVVACAIALTVRFITWLF